jgi:hypothetical protein
MRNTSNTLGTTSLEHFFDLEQMSSARKIYGNKTTEREKRLMLVFKRELFIGPIQFLYLA